MTQPTVASLIVSSELESILRQEFSGWAEHFRVRLREGGLGSLLARYTAVVESIETQSCTHGPDGKLRSGNAWQQCCGISYEYHNDIAVRDAIEIVVSVAGESIPSAFAREIAALDQRLYSHYEHRPPRVGRWWRHGLPRGVLP